MNRALQSLSLILLLFLGGCETDYQIEPVLDPAGLAYTGNARAYLPDGSVYEGEFRDGLMHGEGSLTWPNGARYHGTFVQGEIHGSGRYELNDIYKYAGEYRNGLKHGQGVFESSIGQRYEGEFAYDVFAGEGVFTSYKGDVYRGQFANGRPHGTVSVDYVNGTHYSGEIRDWQFHGQGTFHAANGDIYSGQFVEGKLYGQGKIIYQEGGEYTGEISDWMRTGKGIWLSKRGDRYEGEFNDGDFHGEGTYTSKDGDVYEGGFEHGRFHGKGRMLRKNPKGHKIVETGYWQYGRYVGTKPPAAHATQTSDLPPIHGEEVLFNQYTLLNKTLDNLAPQRDGIIDLYFLAYAPYGAQNVFRNEATFSTALFNRQYQTQARSLALITNPTTLKDTPLATTVNLRHSLTRIASLMHKDEDILFMFLTSHGSKQHELVAQLRGVPLQDLSAKQLAEYLRSSGIKWKVIIVSACYSGGFIDHLKDPHTMVITAARADHVSFGCSDEAELTYFGRAFFKEALAQDKPFRVAFNEAKELVRQWEEQQGYDHSDPQIYIGDAIEEKLTQWRSQRSNKTTTASLD